MLKLGKLNPLFSLLVAASMATATLAAAPASACGGYVRVSESTRAGWAVRAYFAEQSKAISKVDVHLATAQKAAAVVHFNNKTKLPPLHLRLIKQKGSWKVLSTRTWRA